MGLVKATIRNEARILLNELIPGFWLDSDLDLWINSAAIDISTKTYCYEKIASLSLVTATQLYTVETDYLKVLGATYEGIGLRRITPWMQGIQCAELTGPPQFFFEFTYKIGFFPIPTVAENAKIVTTYYAQVTSDITKIPFKFYVPSVLFTVAMALAKERQYAKSTQVQQLYLNSLNLDRKEVEAEKVELPPPQNQHILRMILGPQQ